jgi:acetoacetyl-CoA synthetase
MPIRFYGDLPASNLASKYHSAYFSAHAHVWTHGDCISFHPVTGHLLFHGRSDGVLNRSGVRFGSAEIYNVIDANFSS